MSNARTNMKQIVAVVERGEGADAKKFWTRIGVAFENRDGSWAIDLKAIPMNGKLQMRDPAPPKPVVPAGQAEAVQ